MTKPIDPPSFHRHEDLQAVAAESAVYAQDAAFTYDLQNFYHPFAGRLIERLNSGGIAAMLDPTFLEGLTTPARRFFNAYYSSIEDGIAKINSHDRAIDLGDEPYANYNWELLFHIPLTIAAHLSKNQRFEEAQRWFHLIFNPTTDEHVRRDLRQGACAVDSSQSLHLCATTADGGAWHTIQYSDGSWRQRLSDIKAATSDPGRVVAVASSCDYDDILQVYVITAEGRVRYTIRYPDGSWEPDFGDVKAQISYPGTATSIACAADVARTVQICVTTTDGGIWHTLRRGDGSWQPDFGNVKGVVSDPGFATSIACGAGSNNETHVCTITADGRIWHTIRYPAGPWLPGGFVDVKAHTNDPGPATSIACAVDSNNDVHLFVITADGGIYHALRHPDGTWEPVFEDVKSRAGDPGQPTSIACAVSRRGVQLLMTNSDGVAWEAMRRSDGTWRHFLKGGELDDSWRFWKFLGFRQEGPGQRINELLRLLAKPNKECTDSELAQKLRIQQGYSDIRDHPFQPHVVARTRPLAYRYSVVMKYLQNLIDWGDSLFLQDTAESVNEATQRYVLAANILGPRPVQIPNPGKVGPRTFAQLKKAGLDDTSNALVELEGQFPFDLGRPPDGSSAANGEDAAAPRFDIGRTLYFCVPRNDKLLSFWDVVDDRLYKIRNCMNIQGVVRMLAPFDPPLDPGMLVKAAAAGIDIGGLVNGLNQPIGPMRSPLLIQKALELSGELRNLGGTLLAAIEKSDNEKLARLRQSHEIRLQQMSREVRFLQWKQAEQSSEALLRTRASSLERYRYYQRLLGADVDTEAAPENLPLDRRELTEDNFDEVYQALVEQYDRPIGLHAFPALPIAGAGSPAAQAGADGTGTLYLNTHEDAELNSLLPTARDTRLASSVVDTVGTVLTFIPDIYAKLAFWGLGVGSEIFGGAKLSDATKIAGEILRTISTWNQDQAGMASRTASYQRRADDWLLQSNLAARELVQNGRQLISSMIAEQIARREYINVQAQIAQSVEIDEFMRDKFSSAELYGWMQGELSRLYYQYYRFAFDTGRRAEHAMKQELMRPEVDAIDYVKFNYWDGGRRGLLSGEALYLDIKRMELAYHENNRREYELVRHVSLRQLDPLALLQLKLTGSCEVSIPEALFDRDCPGHYLRRIKTVAVSIPSVTGPYTSVSCTLSLLRSSVRRSPTLRDGTTYERVPDGTDERFVDYYGAVESVVTSGGSNDSGLFETNLRDERILPFEGAGAISSWHIELPAEFPAFDYTSIADLILHVRYTARTGGTALGQAATGEMRTALADADKSGLALFFSLRRDYPTEWTAFLGAAAPDAPFKAKLRKDHFPYMVQSENLAITAIELHGLKGGHLVKRTVGEAPDLELMSEGINASPEHEAALELIQDNDVLRKSADADPYLIFRYRLNA